MTYWADNIKFIKDIQDSKYRKIEEAINDIAEHANRLGEDKACKKARDGYVEASRTLELIDKADLTNLAETMFKDMPEKERSEEEERLKKVLESLDVAMTKIKEDKAKFDIQ